ncbi:DNA (cytosine-5-)-methyltransferase [Alistipes putredinis]|uniref:DNA (cytosine-5-)-methyltransferase n=1 Tax=Alistipes putredinis TaxID=28117 RepID=UPI003A8B5010
MKLRVFTSFSGYDSQLMALRDIGANYECVGWSEIDRWAIKAHNAVFPELADRNYGDITKIDWNAVPDFDLFTYSFPCTDISSAGEQKGFEEDSGTRSSLLWECRRPIAAKRPKFLLMENVKALVSDKYRPLFLKWESWLRSLDYVNYTEILNAKDYGVPQNRERVFMLSILNGCWYEFPHPVRLEKRLKDVLELEVDEKYFLNERGINYVKKKLGKYTAINGEVAMCLTAKGCANWTGTFISDKSIQIGATKETDWNRQQYRVYDPTGISPTITTKSGGGLEPKILMRGRGFNKGGEADIPGTITGSAWEQNNLLDYAGCIRRLTPRECLRLMDVSDGDIDKIQAVGISDTQQYKLAGNSIVKAPMMGIFRNMLKYGLCE